MEARKLLAVGLVAVIILVFLAGYGIVNSVNAKLHYGVKGALIVTLYDPQGKPINLPSPNSIIPLDFIYQGRKVAYVGAKVIAEAVSNGKVSGNVHYVVTLHVKTWWIPPASVPTPRPLGEKTFTKEGDAVVGNDGKLNIHAVFGMIPLAQLLPTDKPDGSQFKVELYAEVVVTSGAVSAKAVSDAVDIYVTYSSGESSTPTITPTTTPIGGGGGGRWSPPKMFKIVRVEVVPNAT